MPKYIAGNLTEWNIIGDTEEEFTDFYDRCGAGEIPIQSPNFTKVYNLTPHPVSVHLPSGNILTFPSDGQARATTEAVDTGSAFGLPVVHLSRSTVEWPEHRFRPEAGSVIIISTITADALRRDHGNPGWTNTVTFLVPDTGPGSVIRDKDGGIAGVKRFEVIFRPTSTLKPWYRPTFNNIPLDCREHYWATEASSLEHELTCAYSWSEDLHRRVLDVVREGGWRVCFGRYEERARKVLKALGSDYPTLYQVDIGGEYVTWVIAGPSWEPTWDRSEIVSRVAQKES